MRRCIIEDDVTKAPYTLRYMVWVVGDDGVDIKIWHPFKWPFGVWVNRFASNIQIIES